jgi:muconate cycloisomerase
VGAALDAGAPAVTPGVERVAVHPLVLPAGDDRRCCVLLELEAGGVCGLGEAPVANGAGLSELLAELAERRPRHPAARAAWAAAELDLRARAAGVPAARLLGERFRPRVRAAWRVAASSPAGVAREVETAAAAGFGTFELVAEAGGGPYDLERLGAARWAAGAGGALRLDLRGRLPAAHAERVLPTLAAFRPALVVGALGAGSSAEAWRRLAAGCGLPLAAEAPEDPGQAAELAAAGVALAVDPALVGGPAVACALGRAAAGPALLRAAPVTAVGLAAALHAACALDVEPLDCGLAAPGPFDADVAAGLVAPGSPWLALPDGPGLGVELDPRALARYRLDR